MLDTHPDDCGWTGRADTSACRRTRSPASADTTVPLEPARPARSRLRRRSEQEQADPGGRRPSSDTRPGPRPPVKSPEKGGSFAFSCRGRARGRRRSPDFSSRLTACAASSSPVTSTTRRAAFGRKMLEFEVETLIRSAPSGLEDPGQDPGAIRDARADDGVHLRPRRPCRAFVGDCRRPRRSSARGSRRRRTRGPTRAARRGGGARRARPAARRGCRGRCRPRSVVRAGDPRHVAERAARALSGSCPSIAPTPPGSEGRSRVHAGGARRRRAGRAAGSIATGRAPSATANAWAAR